MSSDVITSRGLRQFVCIGDRCEDNCCHGWQVPLDRASYQALKTAMCGSPAEADEFRAAVQRERRPARTDESYATIRVGAAGAAGGADACPFLGADRLCSVHARYGPQVLPEICAAYPRVFHRRGVSGVMSGFLSCPELVRLCVLADDGMDLALAPSGLPPPPADAAAARVPDQRLAAAVVAHLARRQLPLAVRLLALVRAAGAQDVAAIADEVAGAQATLAAERDPGRAGRVQLRAALAALADTLASAALAPALARGRQDGPALPPPLAARLDVCLENYARHHWLHSPSTDVTGLLAHTQELLVRLAVLRVLVLAAVPGGRAPDATGLDATIVQVIYRFSRAVEHETGFRRRLIGAVLELAPPTAVPGPPGAWLATL